MSSKKIQILLSSYHVLSMTTNEELIRVRLDLERALRDAPLTPEERGVLQRKYFTSSNPPEVRAGSVGRPRIGETQKEMAVAILGDESKSIKFTRLLQTACSKVAAELGSDYFEREKDMVDA